MRIQQRGEIGHSIANGNCNIKNNAKFISQLLFQRSRSFLYEQNLLNIVKPEYTHSIRSKHSMILFVTYILQYAHQPSMTSLIKGRLPVSEFFTSPAIGVISK